MKLELFVLVLCIFKTAAAADNSTTESTVTSDNTTDVAIASTTVEITPDSDSGNDTTATDSGVESDNMTSASTTSTTSASVTNVIEENSTMSSTNNEATTEPPAENETTAATQQNTTEENTASTASSNTVQQETTPITSTTTMAASTASSNTTQQETTPIASTTTMAATNPCLNTTVVQQCKDQNFTRCVNDSSGQHHCEGCLGGWTLSNGTCRKLPRVIGKVTIKRINGDEASFSVDLTNRNSARFIELAKSCCESFLRASLALECTVTLFTQGSIIVNFELGYPENETNINQTALAESILKDADENGFELDLNVQLSNVVTVFCEDTTCKNDGNCYINDSMMTQCNCIDGYTGSDCSISPATTLAPTTAADSAMALSTEAIIGIAVGCSLALLIIIIIIVVVIKYKGKNKIGSRTDMGRQQRPEDEVPLQKR